MAVNHAERAFRTWPILVERAKTRTKITYGELGQIIDSSTYLSRSSKNLLIECLSNLHQEV